MEPIRALGREYSTEILGATGEPKSATQLSDSLDIPIATCYRRVEELVTAGLLEEYAADTSDTSGATRYRRTTDAVGVRFAPTPSPLAWRCVTQVADAGTAGCTVTEECSKPGCRISFRTYSRQSDASTLVAPTEGETRGDARSAPSDGHDPDAAESAEKWGFTGEDV